MAAGGSGDGGRPPREVEAPLRGPLAKASRPPGAALPRVEAPTTLESPPPGGPQGAAELAPPWVGQPQQVAQSRIFLRPIGTPMPLGFVGLAVATLVLAGYQLSWFPTSQAHQVAWVLIAFAFPVQMVSAVLGFLARDTVVGAGIGVQSVGWLTIGIITLTTAPGSRSLMLGLFLFVAAAALGPSVATGSLGKVLAAAVMGGTALRWILTGVYERIGTSLWKSIAGWEGVALCILALYAAMAFEIEDQRRRTVLPTWRRGSGAEAISGAFPAEVRQVHEEAGARKQL